MYKSNKWRVASPAPREIPVQGELAVTPSQMLVLQRNGIPISSQTIGATYDDGYRTPPDEPPLDTMRGIDVADLWEHRHRVTKGVQEMYGKLFSSNSKTE